MDANSTLVSGILYIAVGAMMCFYGLGFLKGIITITGFVLGYRIAQNTGSTFLVSLIAGGAGAVIALIIILAIKNIASRILAFIAGGMIALGVADLFNLSATSSAVTILLVIATALICALLIDRLDNRFLVIITAAAGASLIMSGAILIFPQLLGWLNQPAGTLGVIASSAIWIVLAVLGTMVQFRLFRETVTTTRLKA